MAQFDGRVALVTGAGSGIGQTTALAYAREGAKVMVSDINETGMQDTVRMIQNAGGEAQSFRADVSNPQDCEAMVNATLEAFGRLDFACNNAGIGGEINDIDSYSIEGWKQVIDIDLNSVFYSLKYEIPAMLKNGGGSIVNMASILGGVGFPNSPAYVAAKHGVVGLTKSAAVEYSMQGVRVNSVGPGFIRTPMIESLEEDKATYDMLVALHPIGRLGQPEEVAELVIWLSSDKASFVTGAYYPVDGGYLAR